MKAFAIWLAIVAVVFGGYALITTMLRETNQVFVFVDSSVQMEPVWRNVHRELDGIDDRDHTEFALAHGQSFSGSELVHSWQPALTLPNDVRPFAGCSFETVSFAEAEDADERILITTTGNECAEQVTALTDWTIIELTP